MNSPGFNILFVCTGNVCRSPLAERMLAAQVGGLPISVESAGTMALVGQPIDPPSADALRELGLSPDGHVARRLTPELITEADLILTAESIHRSAIVQAEPLTFRRAFTIVEFGRLGRELPPLEEVTSDRLKARVREVSGRRGWVDAPPEGADEITDPFGQGLPTAQQTAAVLDAAIHGMAIALGLTPARTQQLGLPTR